MEEFDLKLRISPSDNQFKNLIGTDAYNKLKTEVFKKNGFSCSGCRFHPLDESKALIALSLHLIKLNEQNPLESECNSLCMACHSTQHVDIAIEKEWVQLVNSVHSQKSLIERCRLNDIHSSIRDNETRYLKTPPLDFLEKIKADQLSINPKTKVIFTNKFEWGDL